jgi:acetyl-CoA carboxylase carboxyltransferase component
VQRRVLLRPSSDTVARAYLGVEAAYKRQLEEAEEQGGPEAREAFKQDILRRIEQTSGPMRAVSGFGIEEMIYPADTRKHICEWIVLAYKKLGQANNLGPRAMGYRP